MVFMSGSTSGYGVGRVVQIDQWKSFERKWFSDLYEITGINYTDRDSGAPIVSLSNNHYGGMNIGGHGNYQYGHDWTFLKSKLGLR